VGWLMVGSSPLLPVRAADLDKLDTSLKWIPADAAFYGALLRNREQFDAIAKSRAWAKLKAVPALQALWQMAQAELQKPEGPLAPIAKLAAQGENRQLLELLGDMFGEEVFFYGGSNYIEFADLATQAVSGMRYGPALLKLTGDAGQLDDNQLRLLSLFRILAENPNLLKIPELVIGFKLRDTERANAQLQRLETVLKGLVEQMPQLKGRLQSAKVAGRSFLTLALDGSLVPWKQVPFKQFEDKPGEYDALVKKLSQLKLTVSAGVRDRYLLVVLGESNAHVAKLGGTSRLIDRPELAPLARHADQRLTTIGYASQALMARTGTTPKDIDNLVELAGEALGKAPVTAGQRQRMQKDLAELAKVFKAALPKPGAVVSFSFLTPRGRESYSYDWEESPHRSAAKPLTLLSHVGGTPLFAVVGRSQFSAAHYQTLVKWIQVAYGYVEELAVPKMKPDEKKRFEAFMKEARPLFRRLDEVTAKLLPALADGQWALVLDGRLTSRQWFPLLPPSDKPVPLVTPALVVAVHDADLLRKAFGEYRAIANELLPMVRKLSDEELPELQVPAPQTRPLKTGTLYFYAVPAALGLDQQLVPNAGLSDRVAALALAPAHTERLVAAAPLQVPGGPLADRNRPLVMASYSNCEGLVTALTPWVEMGVRIAAPFLRGQDPDSLVGQARTILEVLKVLRSYSSATYVEDKAVVTHAETVIRDL
jgi:hypothetical protein